MEQRFLRSLLKPSVYPDQTTSVELVQTHVSYIFLTDRFAYKIKKPVDFGFLNFSTIDRRRFYCNEEVRLNSRLCPGTYLDVVEVRETPDGAGFSGQGKIIDYAVRMKRLPAERMLDRLLAEGKVFENEIRAIARTIATFHLHAEQGPEINSYGAIETIRANWEENFRQAGQFTDKTISSHALTSMEKWVDGFIRANEDTFNGRIAGGFIRDCDGDIHMENINLGMDGNICIFDCIEFNARFRYSDTAADIAFLLMDLDINRRADLCAPFIEEYVDVTGDHGVTEVLDFYKIYRAFIRGKVESLRLLDLQISATDKEAAGERARNYFRLARGYIARKGLPPSLILTCGLTGTGKSFIGRELAFYLGVEIISSDVVRKELSGVAPTEHRHVRYGEGIYSDAVTARTYGALLESAEASLAAGRSVIIDATFRNRSDRDAFRNLAERRAARFYLIHTTCPEETTRQRLEARETQGRDVSDGRWEIYLLQKGEFVPPDGHETGLIELDTTKPLDESVDSLLDAMEIPTCG